ncbi:MAG: zinc-ribbon domain-containing protein [Anaerolineae bacterium]|nr:zinc-ribbon domain-containing protein [Anaerolineae bacterium]NIN98887.1 zinc-ribbon domain-containing protein [Anaerolineae bacterium]NIQ81798.1 zinc-ribbon domain-containing protein [Anaerolineae bacterium]
MARVFDVIEYFDATGREMVHRIPEQGSGDFRIGSQVIVRESQQAVFFRDGKALDVFGPGRHTISTANIPLLVDLIGKAFSGETPFKAEVYFANMREYVDQKWGTPEAVALRDTDLGMVRVRAFGTYSMQIKDAQLFVNKIVGTQGLYYTNDIENFLRSIIISNLTDVLGEASKSIFDLPRLYEEIGAGTKAKAQDDFNTVGIDLKILFVSNISPTEETAKAIDERAAMGAIGDMQKYLQFKTARAVEEAAMATGEGAGTFAQMGAGMGAGVGMGAMMAGIMGQAMQGGAAAAGATAATRTCPSCGNPISATAKFCNHCGAKIGEAMICANCKADIPAGSKFCPNCGNPVE